MFAARVRRSGSLLGAAMNQRVDEDVLKLQLPDDRLNALEQSGQVAFRYCDPEGKTGAGYPWNPNGAPGDSAGITNPRGNVLGMMPHPERVFHGWQHSDWSGNGRDPAGPGDGRRLFEGVVRHLCR